MNNVSSGKRLLGARGVKLLSCLLVFLFSLLHKSPDLFKYYSDRVRDTVSTTTYQPEGFTASAPTCDSAVKKVTPREQVMAVATKLYKERRCSEALYDASSNTTDTLIGKEKSGCFFKDVGQALLQSSQKSGTSLLTIQIGGMDGKSNDPFYEMFAQLNANLLQHWLPVVFEPVPGNFYNLQRTYEELQARGVPCTLLEQRAVVYGNSSEGGVHHHGNTCTFCQFNLSSELEFCQTRPDWVKFQIGGLGGCGRLNHMPARKCFSEVPIECGPIEDSLYAWGLSPENIAMLQVDIEGFEPVIFEGILGALTKEAHPPVIHFERKVVVNQNFTKWRNFVQFLRHRGYQLFADGEDALGLLS